MLNPINTDCEAPTSSILGMSQMFSRRSDPLEQKADHCSGTMESAEKADFGEVRTNGFKIQVFTFLWT